MRSALWLTILFLIGPGLLYAQDEEPDLGTKAQREAGHELYVEKCAQCHGTSGAGDGIAAPLLKPRPRDFTPGIYKVRTTASGQLPTSEDIERTIRNGMPYTGMPAWPTLSDQEVTNLMYYLKTFNEDFDGPYGTPDQIEIPEPPSISDESIERGREVYIENQCHDCHGQRGRGDGPSAPTLETRDGNHVYPADMTKRWTFKGGTSRQDIYRTFTTGMNGTPMPSYTIPEEDRWDLVNYVYSLSRDQPNYSTSVISKSVSGDLDVSQGRSLFEEAETAYFPIVGQVVEPGRSFVVATDGIEVSAVHNAEEIAIQLSWHTMTPDTSGSNDPTLEVPPLAERADTLRLDPTETERPTPEYSDAVALQLPRSRREGAAKPYFLFGSAEHPVDLWYADLGQSGPSSYIGNGSGNIVEGDEDLSFYSNYEDGRWTVVFKRDRQPEEGIAFEEGRFVPIAFSVWDGFNRERGNKRGVSTWYDLYVEPLETQSATIPMLKYGLIALLLEGVIIFAVRRRYGNDED